jgi:hypothetical protein
MTLMTYFGHLQFPLCGDAREVSLLREQVLEAQLGQNLIQCIGARNGEPGEVDLYTSVKIPGRGDG